MPALRTGIPTHRDRTEAEKAAGAAPPETVITGQEIMAMVLAIDDHAELIDAFLNFFDEHPAFDDSRTDAESYWSSEKIAAAIDVVNQALETRAGVIEADVEELDTRTTVTDETYDTLQKVVDYLKSIGEQVGDFNEGTRAETVYLDSDGVLALPESPLTIQPYVIDSSGVKTGTDEHGDYVSYSVADPTAAGQRIEVTRLGDKNIRLVGLVDGESDGVIHDRDKATLSLDCVDGIGWTLILNS